MIFLSDGGRMELWKDIPGYEGIYEASNFGNIRTSAGKTTTSEWHGIRHWKQRVLKQKRCKQNCLRVSLWKNGKSKDFLVARLICTTWHENLIDTEYTVNHIDGNRLNNRADNLEWLSRADNIRHGFENGLYKTAKSCVLHCEETGVYAKFRSLDLASEYLGRSHGYVWLCVARGSLATGVDGKKYTIQVETK